MNKDWEIYLTGDEGSYHCWVGSQTDSYCIEWQTGSDITVGLGFDPTTKQRHHCQVVYWPNSIRCHLVHQTTNYFISYPPSDPPTDRDRVPDLPLGGDNYWFGRGMTHQSDFRSQRPEPCNLSTTISFLLRLAKCFLLREIKSRESEILLL